MKVRRRIRALERRITALEARTPEPIRSWDMPPAPIIDMDPDPGITTALAAEPLDVPWSEDDEPLPGVYL